MSSVQQRATNAAVCSLFSDSSQLEAYNKAEDRRGADPSQVHVGWGYEAAGFSGIGGDILGPHVPKIRAFPLTHELEVHRTATEIAGSQRHILDGQPHLSPGCQQLL